MRLANANWQLKRTKLVLSIHLKEARKLAQHWREFIGKLRTLGPSHWSSLGSLMGTSSSLMTSIFWFDYETCASLSIIIIFFNHNGVTFVELIDFADKQLCYCLPSDLVDVSWWSFDQPSRYLQLFRSRNFRIQSPHRPSADTEA